MFNFIRGLAEAYEEDYKQATEEIDPADNLIQEISRTIQFLDITLETDAAQKEKGNNAFLTDERESLVKARKALQRWVNNIISHKETGQCLPLQEQITN